MNSYHGNIENTLILNSTSGYLGKTVIFASSVLLVILLTGCVPLVPVI